MIADEARPLFDAEAKERQEAAGKHHGRGQEKVTPKVAEANAGESRQKAAEVFGVGKTYIDDARAIKRCLEVS